MKLYGLIGYPLGHSFSKKYFTNKFKREGLIDYSYELFPINSIKELPSLINSQPYLKGFNVTIPYKQQVLKYVTETSEAVKEIGAANVIKIDGDKIVAFNTDVIGFKESLIQKLMPFHKKALILGTGGSSNAVQYVLRNLGMEFLLVSTTHQPSSEIISYSMINENIMSDHTLIINCTPVGMKPNFSALPNLPYQFISHKHYLFDLIYNPEKTSFLQKGEQMGAIIQNGYEMLVLQAEESWNIWKQN
ncbi:MAG: shikimate dehydrogenase [Chitinophagaceae bacterium]